MLITDLEYKWYSQDIKLHPLNIKAEHLEVFCLIYEIVEKEYIKYRFVDPENKDRVYLCLSKKQCIELHQLMTAKFKSCKDSTRDPIINLMGQIYNAIYRSGDPFEGLFEAS